MQYSSVRAWCCWLFFFLLFRMFGYIHSFQVQQWAVATKRESTDIYNADKRQYMQLKQFILHSWLYFLTPICNINITGATSIVLHVEGQWCTIDHQWFLECVASSGTRLMSFYNKPLNLSVVFVFVLRSLHEFPSWVTLLWCLETNFMTQSKWCHGINELMKMWWHFLTMNMPPHHLIRIIAWK